MQVSKPSTVQFVLGAGQRNRSRPPAAEPCDEVVRAQLATILASPAFIRSARLSRLLEFIVTTALSGKTELLKESVIGVEVFSKPPSYSPREDPGVRIAAGRLRTKLTEYYMCEGVSDRILINIPKGGYIPRFTESPAFRAKVRRTRRHRSTLAAVAMFMMVAAGLLLPSSIRFVA
jgi:hypothetical protein